MLVSGLILNAIFGGLAGVVRSVEGCVLAFALMLVLHIFGTLGAGDVKLFAATGSVIGINHVLPAFVVVVMTGGLLAVITMLRNGTVRTTMWRVLNILLGFFPGWRMPSYEVPTEQRLTIPYGVAITLGSLVSVFVFRA
jgi:prepilin peptidase CpaA